MRRTVQKFSLAVAALAVIVTATGCAKSTTASPPVPTGSAADTYPVTVGAVTLAQRPTKIVSLSPTATEMLFAIGAGAQVAAVDDNSTYPAQAPKTTLSGYKPNAEAIAKYEPDLVVISNDSEKITAQLTTLHITVFLAPAATTIDDTYRQIADLGRLTGHTAEATDLAGRMRADIASVLNGLPHRATPLTYYYELDPTLYSVTSKTFVGSLLAGAGLVNIADAATKDGNPYPQLSAEVIIKANPDLVLLADSKCCGQSATSVAARPGWAGVAAVKNGGVVTLDDDVASRWGPRVVDLLRSVVTAASAAPRG
jgi:iron complex transport system substrate-binding protein